jgi:hypothetical protein
VLLNYHIGRLVLSSLCVGDLVRLILSGALFAGFSNLMLIWVSYSVNNNNLVAVVLQEANFKKWGQTCP